MFKRAIGRIRASRKAGEQVRAVLAAFALLSVSQMAAAQAQMSLPGKFAVNANGAATYTIPIDVSPGINGIEPKLTLNYNSQSGNGLLGVGWSLGGLSVITRCTQTRAQDGNGWDGRLTYGASDRFCLDGNRLISVPKPTADGLASGSAGAYGADQTYYRTERESFAKIQSFGSVGTAPNAGPSTFKVWTKSGLVMEYGKTTDSKVIAVSKTSVKVWALNKVSDAYGNYMTITYNAPDTVGGQYYPVRIDYTGNDKSTPAISATKSVVFEYDPDPSNNNLPKLRPDVITSFKGGALENWKVRMTKIKVMQNGVLVKYFDLTYKDWSSLDNKGYALSRRLYPSTLASIRLCDGLANCGLPTSIGFRPFVVDESKVLSQPINSFGSNEIPLAASDGTADVMIADFNGDGLSDVLAWNEDFTKNALYLSNGDGSFRKADKFNIKDTLINSKFFQKGSVLADFDGDGLVDILRWSVNPSENIVYLSNGDGSFRKASFYGLQNISLMSNLRIDGRRGDRVFALGDFNGDGLPDLIVWDSLAATTSVYLNDVNGPGFKAVAKGTPYMRGSTDLNEIVVADLNGDGRSDVLMLDTFSFSGGDTWLSFGEGEFVAGPTLPFAIGDVSKTEYVNNAWHFRSPTCGDYNADGSLDFTHVNGNKAIVGDGAGGFVIYDTNSPPSQSLVTLNWQAPWLGTLIGDFDGDGFLDGFNATELLASSSSPYIFHYSMDFSRFPTTVYSDGAGGPKYTRYDGYYFDLIVAEQADANQQKKYFDKYYAGDFNGDGRSDVLALGLDSSKGTVRFSIYSLPTQVQSITTLNTSTPDITISYSTPAKMSGSGYTKSKTYSSGGYAFVPTTQVVSKVVLNAAQGGGHQDIAYSYGGASMDIASGRYYQGFEWVQSEDVTSGRGLVERKYFFQDFPRTGLVRRVTKGTSYLTPDNLGITDFVYGCLDFVGQGCSVAPGKRYFPFVSLITSWGNHDLTSTGGVGVGLPGSKTTVTMDNWGNVLSTSTTALDASGIATDFSKTVTNVFAPADVDNWRLDKVLRSTTTNTVH